MATWHRSAPDCYQPTLEPTDWTGRQFSASSSWLHLPSLCTAKGRTGYDVARLNHKCLIVLDMLEHDAHATSANGTFSPPGRPHSLTMPHTSYILSTVSCVS